MSGANGALLVVDHFLRGLSLMKKKKNERNLLPVTFLKDHRLLYLSTQGLRAHVGHFSRVLKKKDKKKKKKKKHPVTNNFALQTL